MSVNLWKGVVIKLNLIDRLIDFTYLLRETDTGKALYQSNAKVYKELRKKDEFIIFFQTLEHEEHITNFAAPYIVMKKLELYMASNETDTMLPKERAEMFLSNELLKDYAEKSKKFSDFVGSFVKEFIYSEPNLSSSIVTSKTLMMFNKIAEAIGKTGFLKSISKIKEFQEEEMKYVKQKQQTFKNPYPFYPFNENMKEFIKNKISQIDKIPIEIAETLHFFMYIVNQTIFYSFYNQVTMIDESEIIDSKHIASPTSFQYKSIKIDNSSFFNDFCLLVIKGKKNKSYMFPGEISSSYKSNKISTAYTGFVYPEDDIDIFYKLSIVDTINKYDKTKLKIEL